MSSPGKPALVFVCIGNACRSQMAEGWARKIAGENFEIFSAGSHPAGFIAPHAVTVMQEVGIDISRQYSKGLGDLPKKNFEAVIGMGCGISCPYVPARQRIEWNIPDPIGQPLSVFREVRDQIKSEVINLFDSLKKKIELNFLAEDY